MNYPYNLAIYYNTIEQRINSVILDQGSSFRSYEGCNPAGFLSYLVDNCFHLGCLLGRKENRLDVSSGRTKVKTLVFTYLDINSFIRF